ncbi:acetyltransferase [Rubrivirga sp. IMCC43871]|uniref:acetyltransferase n=1 Tax=Rubrivirga sp. IMCC43871 TaxID=3391575 RepID=UPI00399025A8
MREPTPSPQTDRLAEAVREACVRAALDAFEDASISGLCYTGAWECAVGAIRTLDLDAVRATASDPPAPDD